MEQKFAAAVADVQTYQVTTGTIHTIVDGSGILTEEDVETIDVPAGVEVTELISEAGDTVSKGDLIATLEVKYLNSVMTEVEVYAMGNVKSADNTGVVIRSTATRSDSDDSGIMSVIGTICVIVLGLAVAYLGFNAYMRSRLRARRKKRRAARRRNRE